MIGIVVEMDRLPFANKRAPSLRARLIGDAAIPIGFKRKI